MTTPSRTHHQTWSPTWATAPPSSCSTLRNLNGAISWGERCVFAQEDGDPLPFSIDTACMPWITSTAYPPASAFYSPATACPDAWTAVATQSGVASREGWLEGETGLQCCPAGFEADGKTRCRLGGQGKWPVVECGEADAEENELRTYDAAAGSKGAKPTAAALMLRYRGGDVGPEASGTGSGREGGDGGGISTGAVAAVATVIPLAFVVAAIVAWIIWRRRRSRTSGHLALLTKSSEKGESASSSMDTVGHTGSKGTAAKYTMGSFSSQFPHETPEWNAEMDATDTERKQLVTSRGARAAVGNEATGEAAELGGVMRVPRKQIAPVEIDGVQIVPEIGDAYIPYRPGVEAGG
ncbi:hypothetical protein yc1106_03868 [Curvularia clavata]|uniref:Uncharacterized protein n=1 Tax=Curvularia clavata TaxID=95742 RepID=A0A9Q8Z810_CURCL|nr:hypothetical protein yc1106_03868 [Curvularia clavata]